MLDTVPELFLPSVHGVGRVQRGEDEETNGAQEAQGDFAMTIGLHQKPRRNHFRKRIRCQKQ